MTSRRTLLAASALLPVLARQIRTGEEAAARHSMNRALEFALFLTVPAAAALGPLSVSAGREGSKIDSRVARANRS